MNTNKLQKLMCLVPESMIRKQVTKEWKAKTKILNKLPKNKHKIKKLQTNATKTIKYKGKTINKYLDELKKQEEYPTIKQQEFIEWFQTEYIKISFQKITGKPYDPKPRTKK